MPPRASLGISDYVIGLGHVFPMRYTRLFYDLLSQRVDTTLPLEYCASCKGLDVVLTFTGCLFTIYSSVLLRILAELGWLLSRLRRLKTLSIVNNYTITIEQVFCNTTFEDVT